MQMLRNAVNQIVFKLATMGMGPDHPGGGHVLDQFISRGREMNQPRVLEMGTRRSNPELSTRHDQWFPNAGEHLGADIEDGLDVDIVADVHRLSTVVGQEAFDLVVSCSSFEHFKYPHLAAHEIMKVLKVGGLAFIQTHQTYRLHAYPYDYFRFSREGLAGLFGTQMGFEVIETDYEFPARIYAPQVPGLVRTAAFLNVRLLGEKVSETPQIYHYEFDG